MNAKISVFDICVEASMYLLLYNLHDRTFKETHKDATPSQKIQVYAERMNTDIFKVSVFLPGTTEILLITILPGNDDFN